jgi:hypothetical protein
MELGIKIGPVMNMDPRLGYLVGMGFTFIMGEKMMLQACTKVFVVSCLRWCEIVLTIELSALGKKKLNYQNWLEKYGG